MSCGGRAGANDGAGEPCAARRSSRSASSRPIRSPGSLRSSPCRTGASGPARRSGSGSSDRTAAITPHTSGRPNGGRPSTAAYSVAPSDHRSDAGVAFWCRACSGATYAGDPMIAPAWVSVSSPATVAMPKSVRTARPGAISTFPGLTSRCTTPAACAAPSASSRSSPIAATRAGGSGPSREMTLSSPSARTRRITIHGRPSSSTTS